MGKLLPNLLSLSHVAKNMFDLQVAKMQLENRKLELEIQELEKLPRMAQ